MQSIDQKLYELRRKRIRRVLEDSSYTHARVAQEIGRHRVSVTRALNNATCTPLLSEMEELLGVGPHPVVESIKDQIRSADDT